MFRTILAPIVILAAFAVAACGDDAEGGGGSPEDAARELVTQLSNGQYGRAYETMHPAQQEFIARDFFMSCADENSATFELEEFEVVEVFEEEYAISGADRADMAYAVTYRAEVRSGEDTATFTDTGHLFDVDGEWRWAWDYGDAAREGNCQ